VNCGRFRRSNQSTPATHSTSSRFSQNGFPPSRVMTVASSFWRARKSRAMPWSICAFSTAEPSATSERLRVQRLRRDRHRRSAARNVINDFFGGGIEDGDTFAIGFQPLTADPLASHRLRSLTIFARLSILLCPSLWRTSPWFLFRACLSICFSAVREVFSSIWSRSS